MWKRWRRHDCTHDLDKRAHDWRDWKSEAAARRSEISLMISCGILGMTTILAFTGVGCIAFDVSDPYKESVVGGADESQDRRSERRASWTPTREGSSHTGSSSQRLKRTADRYGFLHNGPLTFNAIHTCDQFKSRHSFLLYVGDLYCNLVAIQQNESQVKAVIQRAQYIHSMLPSPLSTLGRREEVNVRAARVVAVE